MPAAALGLLNRTQRGFPLVPRPYAALGREHGLSEAEVLGAYRDSRTRGVLARVGVLFRPNTIGASTLAALAVPQGDLERVAALVSAQPGVNHNYEREHRWNLWFVATGDTPARVEASLQAIERASALPALRCPLLEEYHIDLGFDLRDGSVPREPRRVDRVEPGAAERRLAAALAEGIPLSPRPYALLGLQAGMPEAEVIATLARWLERGVARRIGAVLRHRRLGWRANAMAVWDVPDGEVRALGARAARDGAVTLCYRRARSPGWPYNLYCMIHGRSRARTQSELARLAAQTGLARFPDAVLFSRRCFAQRAARYGAAHG